MSWWQNLNSFNSFCSNINLYFVLCWDNCDNDLAVVPQIRLPSCHRFDCRCVPQFGCSATSSLATDSAFLHQIFSSFHRLCPCVRNFDTVRCHRFFCCVHATDFADVPQIILLRGATDFAAASQFTVHKTLRRYLENIVVFPLALLKNEWLVKSETERAYKFS